MSSFRPAIWGHSHSLGLIRRWIKTRRNAALAPAKAAPCFTDLERLAMTSPHLLEDIGFTRCETPQPAAEQIWQSQTLRLVLRERGPEPEVFIERIEPDIKGTCA